MIDLSDLPRFAATPEGEMRSAVEAAIAQMRRNATRTMNLDALARHVNLNPFHLSHIFSRYVGISAKRYHQLIRISSAKRTLARTEMNVTDVSLECGYDSLGSFATTFKRTVGLTPTEFRKALSTLTSLEMPEISPSSASVGGAAGLCLEIAAPADFHGCAFVAACRAESGHLMDCAAISFFHRSSITFSIPRWQPLIFFGVAYSSRVSIRDAIVGEPELRGCCEVVSGPAPHSKVTLNLREARIIDAPFVSALPLLVRHRVIMAASLRQDRCRDSELPVTASAPTTPVTSHI